MFRPVSIVFTGMLLCCSPAHCDDSANALANIHTVAIVSAIGHTVALQNVGLMVFTNSTDKFDADSWGLDDLVIKDATADLGDRFAVKTVDYDHEAFATQDTSWWNASSVPVEKLVANLPSRDGIDAFIVIYPVAVQDPILQTNQYMRGLGLYRHVFGFDHMHAAYAFYAVAVVDAHTNKIIADGSGRLGNPALFSPKFPVAFCPETIWSETAAAMSDDQKASLKAAYADLMKASLPWALHSAGLVLQTPADAPAPACAFKAASAQSAAP